MTDAEIRAILDDLEHGSDAYQRIAIDAACEHRAEIAPHLIHILDQICGNPEAFVPKMDYEGHIYGLVLLTHFREPRAHEVILRLARIDGDLLDQLFGDVITQDLGTALHATCGGSLAGLRELALDRGACSYSRTAAMGAMVLAVAAGEAEREEVLDFIGGLFSMDETEPESYFWDGAAGCLLDLYPVDWMETVSSAYERGLIDPGHIGPEDFEATLELGLEASVTRLARLHDQAYPEDIHARMSWWNTYDERDDSELRMLTSDWFHGLTRAVDSAPPGQRVSDTHLADKALRKRRKAERKARKKARKKTHKKARKRKKKR